MLRERKKKPKLIETDDEKQVVDVTNQEITSSLGIMRYSRSNSKEIVFAEWFKRTIRENQH